ncbi:hypothetical protein HY085_02110 [Candidatus Gottesmanbacteria bacterium]|nr:hypothetical protein [Candidatus Gottesmanbacteria bacterium]
MKEISKKIDRRTFLKLVGGTAVVTSVGGVLYAISNSNLAGKTQPEIKPVRPSGGLVLRSKEISGERIPVRGSEQNDFLVNLIYSSTGDMAELVIPAGRFGDALFVTDSKPDAASESKVEIDAYFKYHDPKYKEGEPFSSYIQVDEHSWWIQKNKSFSWH